jgi:hypothetical protein
MSALFASDIGPYVMLLLIGFLPSEIWRLLSVVVVRGLDDASAFVVWVRTIATTLLAGVVAKIIFTPPGALAIVPLSGRVDALLIGLAAFYLARRSVVAAICVGQSVLMGIGWLMQP